MNLKGYEIFRTIDFSGNKKYLVVKFTSPKYQFILLNSKKSLLYYFKGIKKIFPSCKKRLEILYQLKKLDLSKTIKGIVLLYHQINLDSSTKIQFSSTIKMGSSAMLVLAFVFDNYNNNLCTFYDKRKFDFKTLSLGAKLKEYGTLWDELELWGIRAEKFTEYFDKHIEEL